MFASNDVLTAWGRTTYGFRSTLGHIVYVVVVQWVALLAIRCKCELELLSLCCGWVESGFSRKHDNNLIGYVTLIQAVTSGCVLIFHPVIPGTADQDKITNR